MRSCRLTHSSCYSHSPSTASHWFYLFSIPAYHGSRGQRVVNGRVCVSVRTVDNDNQSAVIVTSAHVSSRHLSVSLSVCVCLSVSVPLTSSCCSVLTVNVGLCVDAVHLTVLPPQSCLSARNINSYAPSHTHTHTHTHTAHSYY